MKQFINIYWVIAIAINVAGCKKFVDVDPPPTQLVGATVYTSDATAASTITGIYQTMASNTIAGGGIGISGLLGLSSDEFNLYSTIDETYSHTYSNTLKSNSNILYWLDLYNCIYQANSAINGITASQGLTASIKQQLLGESKFIRAFCYFYLTNIFGDVPMVISTDYNVNKIIPRSSKTDIENLIIADLKEAQTTLSDDYLKPDGTTTESRGTAE